MGSVNPNHKKTSNLYPEVIVSSPDAAPARSSSSSCSSLPPSFNLYPTIDMRDLVENLFPEPYDRDDPRTPSAPPEAVEEVLIRVLGAILNLIDRNYSVELACGDFSIVRLRQGDKVVAVLARVDDEIQWPLAKDEAAVKLDDSHYFFSLRLPEEHHSDSDSSDDETEHGKKKKKNKKKKKKKEPEMLNYGLTIASKGQEPLLKQLDEVLKAYSCFSVQKVSEHAKGEVVDETVAKEISPADLESGGTKEMMEGKCVAYWTTLAPNVEDYSGTAAKLIAMGSGQLIKGILWCGDVTIDRLKKGNEVMKNRMSPRAAAEVSPETLKRIKRVKRITGMTERVATGVLSGVVKVTGLFTSKVANSRVGKKFFGLLPGEVVLASLDGFSKLCDAAEVAGKNVMSTSSTVTTELVTHRYGEKAAEATSEGLDAAGHAIGTAWAAFKIRKALNPKSALKPTSLAKSAAKAAAAEIKAKKSK